jgi:hypothetical protein
MGGAPQAARPVPAAALTDESGVSFGLQYSTRGTEQLRADEGMELRQLKVDRRIGVIHDHPDTGDVRPRLPDEAHCAFHLATGL